MPWEVLRTEEFDAWFDALEERERRLLLAPLLALRQDGPKLGRPYVDSVYDSKHSNMKELRKKGKPPRVFFAFDPKRRAVLLIGGSKDGSKDKSFYDRMIPIADEILDRWLAAVKAESGR